LVLCVVVIMRVMYLNGVFVYPCVLKYFLLFAIRFLPSIVVSGEDYFGYLCDCNHEGYVFKWGACLSMGIKKNYHLQWDFFHLLMFMVVNGRLF